MCVRTLYVAAVPTSCKCSSLFSSFRHRKYKGALVPVPVMDFSSSIRNTAAPPPVEGSTGH